jgi:glyceraldehyde-3-phosphate dehydrogenase/erythrose-4-phosphate dehydrogenase
MAVRAGINGIGRWYDDEWGYSTRLAELAQRVMSPVREVV